MADDRLGKSIRNVCNERKTMANPQEQGAPVEMWANDNDTQFIAKEIQTSVNVNKCNTQRYCEVKLKATMRLAKIRKLDNAKCGGDMAVEETCARLVLSVLEGNLTVFNKITFIVLCDLAVMFVGIYLKNLHASSPGTVCKTLITVLIVPVAIKWVDEMGAG